MRYVDFNGEKLSQLGMGCMRLPGTTGFSFGRINRKKANEIIDFAYRHGVNYYDTAHVYGLGDSERFLGAKLSKYPRDSFNIATKYNILGGGPIKRQFEHQLRRLKTDYIDFYLVHAVMDSNAERYIKSGVIEFLEEKKREGKIRYLGFSSHASAKVLERFASLRAWDFAQLQLNYYDWQFRDAEALYNVLYSRGIPIMVMEPVRGGKLASLGAQADAVLKSYEPDASIASWAFRYMMGKPGIAVILSGMSDMAQVRDNVNTFDTREPLDSRELGVLQTACSMFEKRLAVPCTSCRYCTETCPSHIDIPQFMSVYNTLFADGAEAAQRELAGVKSKGRPRDCVSCRACEAHCPQGIAIPEHLAEVAALE